MVEKNSARDAHEKLSLFYCFISLKKTKSVNSYKQLNAKRDIKQINYFSDINWQKMAERGADVSARDIMFAPYYLEYHPNKNVATWSIYLTSK